MSQLTNLVNGSSSGNTSRSATWVRGALDDERNGQGDSYSPCRYNERHHVTSFLRTTHAQWIDDAYVTVQCDGAQVHYGRRRQYDIRSGPRQAYVQTQVPVTGHLQQNKDKLMSTERWNRRNVQHSQRNRAILLFRILPQRSQKSALEFCQQLVQISY